MKPAMEQFDDLWVQFYPLVASEAGRILSSFNDHALEFADLEQEGRIALWRCIERFDPSKNTYGSRQRDPYGHFAGYLKRALHSNLLSYARKTCPHYYTGDSSTAKWHHIRVSSLEQLPESLQDSHPSFPED